MRQIILPALILLVMSGCNQQKKNTNSGLTFNERGVPQYSEVQSGGVKMITVDGKYQVWTKKIGSGDWAGFRS